MKSKVITEVMFTLLFIGMLTLAFNIQPAKASGTIYIRADGSVDPPTAPISTVDNITYTFTGNINESIVIERDNIVVDGAGYTLDGRRDWMTGGMCLYGRSNVTIRNIEIRAFGAGIYLDSSSSNIISGNNITNNSDGIWLNFSSNNTISENNIRANNDNGILLKYSSNNTINENNITNNWHGIVLKFSSNNIFYHNEFDRPADLTSSQSNLWDNGYPSGGNYWSNHRSTDLFSGPYQNITGCDGIFDTPYAYGGVLDRYPLIFPWGSPHSPVASFSVQAPSVPMRAGETLTFNASFSLPSWNGTHAIPITEYRWDFGDGNITSTVGYIIVHTYSLAGTYNVSLTVLDSEGPNSSCVQTIEVWMPTFISISTSSLSTFVGFAVDINGTLYDIHRDGLENQTVVLFYTFSGANTWVPITSDTTNHLGNYYVKWIPPATGYFTIKAEWTGNSTHFGANNTVSLSSIPYQNKYVFSVESNSTVSSLAFNSTNRMLSFMVSGPSGTKGYVKVTVAKTLVGDIADVKVYLDGSQLNYTVTSLDDSWLLYFTYLHSTHEVTISLSDISTPFIETPLGKVVLYGIPITAIIILIVLYVLRKKQKIKDPRVNV